MGRGERVKLIIAGSRHLKPSTATISWELYEKKLLPTEIVSGGAKGVDYAGWLFAKEFKLPCAVYEPKWGEYGKAAGPKRNRLMAEYADALLLIWDGKSRGSKNMKEEMKKLNKPVYEVIWNEPF